MIKNVLTTISASVIVYISPTDITRDDIKEKERGRMANPAMTEAVYYILLSLMEPLHGYGIMQNVEQLSNGRVRLAAGTLYGAINTLLEKGWIVAVAEGNFSEKGFAHDKGNRKKEYLITEQGKEMLRGEIARLRELIENGNRIMEKTEN